MVQLGGFSFYLFNLYNLIKNPALAKFDSSRKEILFLANNIVKKDNKDITVDTGFDILGKKVSKTMD